MRAVDEAEVRPAVIVEEVESLALSNEWDN